VPTDATQKVLPSPSRQFNAPERRRNTRRVITPLPPPLPIQQPNTRNATFMSCFSCWRPHWRHEEGYYPPSPLPFYSPPTQHKKCDLHVTFLVLAPSLASVTYRRRETRLYGRVFRLQRFQVSFTDEKCNFTATWSRISRVSALPSPPSLSKHEKCDSIATWSCISCVGAVLSP